MLLAAGRGERLRPLTDSLPKPLVEVRGRSLIERHLDTLAGAGIERVVINMGWLGDQLAERLASGERYGLSIVFSDERDGILETAGGIRNALPLLGRAPFLVVNADIFTDMPLPCPCPTADELAHLVLVPKPSFKETGDFGIAGGRLVERIGSGERYGLSVIFSDERDGILETAGGIRNALPLLGRAPFLVVNADIFTDVPLPCPGPATDELAHLVLVPKPSFKATGDFGIAGGRLVNEDAPAYTFSGVATYRPEFFADLEPGRRPLAPLLRKAADAGRIGASVYEGSWEDVGTPERLAALNA